METLSSRTRSSPLRERWRPIGESYRIGLTIGKISNHLVGEQLCLLGLDSLFRPLFQGFPLESSKYNSLVDAFDPDYKKYPLLREAHALDCTQYQGEMMIIPTGERLVFFFFFFELCL